MKFVFLVLVILSLSACLKTRSELRGDYNPSPRNSANSAPATQGGSQQQRAQIDSRFFEIDQDFRQLYGKIEILEKKVSDLAPQSGAGAVSSEESSAKMSRLEKRMSTIEEALLSLDKKVSQLGNTGSSISPDKIKGPFARGEAYFARAQYEKAIESYDQYRKNFPKGQKYADATLRMGQAFQRLKMNQDAKAFYQEVIQRFPKTAVANKAQENLKSI